MSTESTDQSTASSQTSSDQQSESMQNLDAPKDDVDPIVGTTVVPLTSSSSATNDQIAIGIDYGTTNSCVAVMDESGKPQILTDQQGKTLVPSAFACKDGKIWSCGRQAQAHAKAFPREVIYETKRLLGRTTNQQSDIRPFIDKWPFEVAVRGEEWILKVGAGEHTPKQAAQYMFEHLNRVAYLKLEKAITKAVICVPAYAGHKQRELTEQAAKDAGLEVLQIIAEPTAAVLAHDLQDGIALVYDLGGGTFDVSVVKIKKRSSGQCVYEVLSTLGNNEIGGARFDEAIMHFCVQQLPEAHRNLIMGSKLLLKKAAEKAKCTLQTDSATTINVPNIAEGISLDQVITREQFENLIREDIQTTINLSNQCFLKACEKSKAEAGIILTAIVLVGGSTRLQIVRNSLATEFPDVPVYQQNPDETVALGAARMAEKLAVNRYRRDQMELFEATPFNLGIADSTKCLAVILPAGTRIPFVQGYEFTTLLDAQHSANIDVYEGDSPVVSKNSLIASFVLEKLQVRERGEATIKITFAIQRNFKLEITAAEIVNKVARQTVLKKVNIRSDRNMEEIEQQRAAAFDSANEDTEEANTRSILRNLIDQIFSLIDTAKNDIVVGVVPAERDEWILEARALAIRILSSTDIGAELMSPATANAEYENLGQRLRNLSNPANP